MNEGAENNRNKKYEVSDTLIKRIDALTALRKPPFVIAEKGPPYKYGECV
jgi:hypothetical protein